MALSRHEFLLAADETLDNLNAMYTNNGNAGNSNNNGRAIKVS